MGLKQRLQQDLQEAMRLRDETRKSALRMALSSLQLAEVEKGDLDDNAIVAILQREVKSHEEALDFAHQGAREDLVVQEMEMLKILRAYLPQSLSEEEVRTLVREAIAASGATSPADLGKVMKVLMPQVKGRADGQWVSQVVRELLSA